MEHAPAAPGVYGISNARVWVYIGETHNIREALLAHLDGSASPALNSQGAGFVFETCNWGGRLARRDRLVSEYGPILNRSL